MFNLNPDEYVMTGKIIGVTSIVILAMVNYYTPQVIPLFNRLMMYFKVLTSVVVVIGAIAGPRAYDRSAAFLFNDGNGCFHGTNWSGLANAVTFALFGKTRCLQNS